VDAKQVLCAAPNKKFIPGLSNAAEFPLADEPLMDRTGVDGRRRTLQRYAPGIERVMFVKASWRNVFTNIIWTNLSRK